MFEISESLIFRNLIKKVFSTEPGERFIEFKGSTWNCACKTEMWQKSTVLIAIVQRTKI